MEATVKAPFKDAYDALPLKIARRVRNEIMIENDWSTVTFYNKKEGKR